MKLNIPDNAWPEWAVSAAMDKNGDIWFYEKRPDKGDSEWDNKSRKKLRYYCCITEEWNETLTMRPGVDDET